MRRRSSTLFMLVPLVALGACGGTKQSAATPNADSSSSLVPPRVVADSASRAAAESAGKSTPPGTAVKKPDSAKVETGDYDRAGRPKFRVDEKTGAITPIKRP